MNYEKEHYMRLAEQCMQRALNGDPMRSDNWLNRASVYEAIAHDCEKEERGKYGYMRMR